MMAFDAKADKAEQHNELEAVEAIYGDDFALFPSEDVSDKRVNLVIHVTPTLDFVALLPIQYPSHELPIVSLRSSTLSRHEITSLKEAMLLGNSDPGEVKLFAMVEQLKQELSAKEEEGRESRESDDEEGNVPKGGIALRVTELSQEMDQLSLQCVPEIIHGKPFVDRRSTFQAHIARIKTSAEVKLVMRELLSDNKIVRATHNIMAYRVYDEERGGILAHDCDDDGETAAGSRLAELLHLLPADNVVVVCSRWFGGIKLGPDRFKHINNTCRNLLEEHGFCPPKKTDGKKKR